MSRPSHRFVQDSTPSIQRQTKGSCLYAVRLELDAPVTNSNPAT